MVRSIQSLGLQGVTGYLVTAECDLSSGLPAFDVVGLPDAAVNEARERVRAAIKNCGFTFPVSRITVNLAPAHLKKIGTLYDLPMLVGILAAGKQLRLPKENCAFLGELSLSGQLRPWAPNPAAFHCPDLSEVKGQEQVKRALEIAAAGGHSVLMSGPPGTGKSMLARRLPGILPNMTRQEALECTEIHSIMGQTSARQPLITLRPFRSPHHTVSSTGMAGGGSNPVHAGVCHEPLQVRLVRPPLRPVPLLPGGGEKVPVPAVRTPAGPAGSVCRGVPPGV